MFDVGCGITSIASGGATKLLESTTHTGSAIGTVSKDEIKNVN